MSEETRIRVLVAKPGLDGHDRGAKVVARGLRDAGFEVIYTGLHRTPAQIVRAAVDEDVHVVGLSVLSGAHDALLPAVVKGLREAGRDDVLVIAGGIIPAADAERPFPITSVRAGSIPGIHRLAYDGPHDTVTLEHVARSRDGFAAGAVLAAEWLPGRRGVFTFEEMLFGEKP